MSIFWDQSKKNDGERVGVGVVKRKHKSISTSDADMVNEYKGHGILNFEQTTKLLSGKIFSTDILNETASNCAVIGFEIQ